MNLKTLQGKVRRAFQITGRYIFRPIFSPVEFYETEILPESPDNGNFIILFTSSFLLLGGISAYFAKSSLSSTVPKMEILGYNLVEAPMLGGALLAFLFASGIVGMGAFIGVLESIGFVLCRYKTFSMKNHIYLRIFQLPAYFAVCICLAIISVVIQLALGSAGFDISHAARAKYALLVSLPFWIVPPWIVLKKIFNSWFLPLPLIFGYLIYLLIYI